MSTFCSQTDHLVLQDSVVMCFSWPDSLTRSECNAHWVLQQEKLQPPLRPILGRLKIWTVPTSAALMGAWTNHYHPRRAWANQTACKYVYSDWTNESHLHPTGSIWSRWQGNAKKSSRVTRASAWEPHALACFTPPAPLRPSLYLTTRADPGHLCVFTSPRAQVSSRSSFSVHAFSG